MQTKIAQIGLGPIGIETLKAVATRPWARVVGAVDIDPVKRNRDLEELTGIGKLRGRRVYGSVAELLSHQRPEMVLHTAVSRFKAAYAQLHGLAERGIDVVSSCEEMVFPQLREPRLAAQLDRICRQTGARMVGTGVNPGFVMDVLPLCLSGVCREVRAVHVQRVVNASTRREPLQRKIGSGWAPEEFRRRFKAGQAGHAGLRESLALIAYCLGWKITGLRESGEPVVAEHDIETQFLSVKAGQTCGLHQRAEARRKGKLCLTLDLKMFLNAPEPHDAVQIDGEPPVEMVIRGGVAGDQATVAALVNTAPRLLLAAAGLRLMTDLTVPRSAAGQ